MGEWVAVPRSPIDEIPTFNGFCNLHSAQITLCFLKDSRNYLLYDWWPRSSSLAWRASLLRGARWRPRRLTTAHMRITTALRAPRTRALDGTTTTCFTSLSLLSSCFSFVCPPQSSLLTATAPPPPSPSSPPRAHTHTHSYPPSSPGPRTPTPASPPRTNQQVVTVTLSLFHVRQLRRLISCRPRTRYVVSVCALLRRLPGPALPLSACSCLVPGLLPGAARPPFVYTAAR